jgi:hypothetical protein
VRSRCAQSKREHPLDSFALCEKAHKQLAELEALIGAPVREIRFSAEELEQARALGALHGEQWQAVVVDAHIAGQLAEDYLARCVRVHRANQRPNANTRRAQANDPNPGVDVDQPAATDNEAEARRAQREAERQARERATAFNLELGRSLYMGLSRVKADERTLKLLSSRSGSSRGRGRSES